MTANVEELPLRFRAFQRQVMRCRYSFVEEKLDGTNVGIHFSEPGKMVLQCRGHLQSVNSLMDQIKIGLPN